MTEVFNLDTSVKLEPLNADLLKLEHVARWSAMEVVDDPSKNLCSERMDLLYQQKKKLKADRDRVVKPLNQAIKEVDAMVKPILVPLESAYATLNGKLGVYQEKRRREEEDRQRKEREAEAARIKEQADRKAEEAVETDSDAKLDEAVADERHAEAILNLPAHAPQRSEVSSGATFVPVTRWKCRVLDEAKIPRDYLMPDLTKLGAAAVEYGKDHKGCPSIELISGVEFYPETTNQRRG